MVLEVVDRSSVLQDTATKAPYKSLFTLPPQEQIQRVKELGSENFIFMLDHSPESELLHASLGRHDDVSFKGTRWTRDIEEAIALALDPFFRATFPEHVEAAESFFLTQQRLLLRRYAWENEWWRFDMRPELVEPKERGLVMVHDDLAPTTKFEDGERRVHPWSHNQLDATAKVLMLSAQAIKLGLPLLDPTPDDIKPAGEILLKMTTYHAAQTGPSVLTHGPWEDWHCLTPGSTKGENNAALIGVFKTYPRLTQDATEKGYPVYIGRRELSQAIYTGTATQYREFPNDWTTSSNHPDPEDLAQLRFLADVEQPPYYTQVILDQTQSLEGDLGYIRFRGDKWKKNEGNALWAEHALWGLGFLYRGYIDAKLAIRKFFVGDFSSARRYLDHGLLMLDRIGRMIHEYGYLPELHFQNPYNGFSYEPNDNDLAWGRGMTVRLCGAISVALKAGQFHQLKAA